MEALLIEPIGAHREIYSEFINLLAKDSVSFASVNLRDYTGLLDYHALETLAGQLALQLDALEARGFTLLFWQVSDILVVNNGEFYLLANLSQLVPLYKKDKAKLMLVYPTVYPLPVAMCAPELLKMDVLPFITPRSASYYSLGLLFLSLLSITKYNLSLERIQGTKLFYFLERCLKIEPSERMCLLL